VRVYEIEFTCLCCGLVFAYEYGHKLNDDGIVCSDCLVECNWEV
jgi:hypothetical protein